MPSSYPRFRQVNPPDLLQDVDFYLNGVYNNTQQVLTQSLDTWISDVVTPGYRNIIAAGGIVNNPMHLHNSFLKSEGAWHYQAFLTGTSRIDHFEGPGSLTGFVLQKVGGPGGIPIPGFDDTTTADVNAAKVMCLRNIDTTPAAMAEDVAEIRETIRFLKNPAASLFKLSKAFRRDVKKHRKVKFNRSQAVADVWLNYRFAVSPLVRSIHDLTGVLNDNLRKAVPLRRTARGKRVQESSGSDSLTAGPWSSVWSRTGSFSSTVSAYVLYEVTNPISDIRSSLGLRAKDVPVTIWAVMPYSFMFDRVLDVSSYIGAFTNILDPNVKILAAGTTRRTEKILTTQLTGEVNASWTFNIQGDVVTEHTFDYQRDLWTTLSDITPVFDSTGLISDSTKITDLLALSLRFFS